MLYQRLGCGILDLSLAQMPIYQYTCTRCGMQSETLRRIAERDFPAVCSSCGDKCIRDLFPGAHVGRSLRGERSNQEQPGNERAGIVVEGPAKITIEDSAFFGWKRGIVAHEDARISLKNTKFRNVEVPVERKRK